MEKHLIVVSIDAMVYEDLAYCKTLPNFSKIMKDAAVIERVRTCYPSFTHPVHATLLTGTPTGATGVINNAVFNPQSPDAGSDIWYNWMDQIQGETIFHAAKRAGLTTAACTWPMTSGGQGVIDYLVPCALNADFVGYEDHPLDVYRRLGAQECLMPIVEEAVKRFTYKNEHPCFEEFQIYCCAEIIKRYRPNLVLTHPAYVDNRRHHGGVFHEGVEHALRETDRWLGMLLDAVKEAGIEESTDFVLLSDHGHINVQRIVSPNVIFYEKGYIQTDENGNASDWRVFCKSAGGSAHIYLKDPSDRALYDEVYRMLSDMAEEGIYGFECVYTAEQTKEKYGLYGDFSFALEGDGYSDFGEWYDRPYVRANEFSDYRFSRGTHGHAPEKGPQPPFLASGPSFKSGVVIREGSILDHAPTMAAALGLSLPMAEGKTVREILR